ncbi:MAG: MerR family transcriptional regulator [Ruminococcaceae bacterium]|nr:MerR family transcriptional regulator [Oscillospiraceae bacterium]
MTIRDFARLCGCNPQTLRYYDQVGLLKPAEVDRWTGYRHYEKEQALDFIRIKHLRSAGFSISEIKALPGRDSGAICTALDRKVAELEEKVKEIKGIRASYQSEMNDMEQKIRAVQERVTRDMHAYDAAEEFGIDDAQYARITASVNDAFAGWMAESGDVDYQEFTDGGGDGMEEDAFLDLLHDPAYETVYESHGWTHVKEFLAEFAELEDGAAYALVFEVTEDKAKSLAFSNTILGILLERNPGKKRNLACSVTSSKDGENHFWLLRRR